MDIEILRALEVDGEKLRQLTGEDHGPFHEETIDYEQAFDTMCVYYISIMEGDTHMVEDAYALMFKHGIVDKDGFEL